MTQPAPGINPEPWLRGTRTEVPAVIRGVLHAFDLAREDVLRWTEGFSFDQIHAKPHGLPSVGFQMRHIVRSLDRLLTYADGKLLSEEQLMSLRNEADPEISADEIRAEFDAGLARAYERVTGYAGVDVETIRTVGRKLLPTCVGGLLVHMADHTQRHTGQLVTTAKVVRSL